MNKNALLLSLGHNSSAIFTNGKETIGYETERLDRVKSSSNSPILAIEQIEKFVKIPKETPVFMTHWFDYFGTFPPNKYIDKINDFVVSKGSKLFTHSQNFTHHDAHAYSAKSFFRYYIKDTHIKYTVNEDIYFIVADGFGNFQEVLSIYTLDKVNSNKLNCVYKYYGYETSLGLMYQYATYFCGMKMNQDEYKLLGYESKIQDFFDHGEILKIQDFSVTLRNVFIKAIVDNRQGTFQGTEHLINFSYLEKVRQNWEKRFEKLCKELDITDYNSEKCRVAIAFYVQSTIEKVLGFIIDNYQMANVVLSGGIFYNVKLNNKILKQIPGIFSVVPVAGDQGASIGFYEKYVGDFDWSTLAIGNREFSEDRLRIMEDNERVYYPRTEDYCVELIFEKIIAGEIVNLVTDKMEYGPRALGNTSSLFYPVERLSKLNNQLNRRSEVMPFAPIVLEETSAYIFGEDYKRVVGSDKFMILTYDYKLPIDDSVAGVYHKYPLEEKYSGRPQIVNQKSNLLLHNLLSKLHVYECQDLITNTSYNYHGEPIVYSLEDVLKTHYLQLKNAKDLDVKVNLVLYNQSSS